MRATFQRVKLVIFIFKYSYTTEKKHFYGIKKKTAKGLRPRCLTLNGKSNRHMPAKISSYFITFIVLPSTVLTTFTPGASSFTCVPLSVYIALRQLSVEASRLADDIPAIIASVLTLH